MTLPGWKAPDSDRDGSRPGSSAPVSRGDASRPAARAAGPAHGMDAAPDSGKAAGTGPAKYLNRMTVRAGDKIVLVPVCDVLWIQSHGNLVRLHLQNANYEHRMTIKDMYRRLDPERFLRVHRSVIVNLDHVVDFDLPRGGNAFVHLRNGKALPISGSARTTLRRGLLSQSYASAD
jgi:DNA-binding LytR/AlgR family response regulator